MEMSQSKEPNWHWAQVCACAGGGSQWNHSQMPLLHIEYELISMITTL